MPIILLLSARFINNFDHTALNPSIVHNPRNHQRFGSLHPAWPARSAQPSAVETVQSQRREDSGVTKENNEISEGKLLGRVTGGKPGEQKHSNRKD
ncbi:collagen alpha-1(XIV) chain-like protein [Lates japonicus]|uniref:Collagen alpha-1(XIV) chain-like protein n=1 Tax=Lates japonicus TaxID=270547 RepID=A0AAD3NHL6_LATJO|nr:collagen alpha-1(XIV) chain-like protein [Lates japonicus]